MQALLTHEFAHGTVHIVHTTKIDGDLSPALNAAAELAERRREVVDMAWHTVRQVHSDRVVMVGPASARQGRLARGHLAIGDALVTREPDVALAVHSGDCVPVGFVSAHGAIAVAHAGWKGLEAGVLESTVRTLRTQCAAATDAMVHAVVGPHICADCYEFGAEDLARMADRFSPAVVATTTTGRPSLDLGVAVSTELERLGVEVAGVSGDCTATLADRYWSHRRRGERGRFALVAWIEP